MYIKEIIESKFNLKVNDILILGQGLDSIAYLVNYEYIFKQSKHNDARNNLKREIQVLKYLKGKITLQIPDIEYYSEECIDNLYKRILNDERVTQYVKTLCHNDLSCNHILIQNNKVVGIIDFGDVAITDKDKDFVYLLEDSREEIGREFGLRILEHYNHPNKDIAILKANLNEEYYPIEQILGGQVKELTDMYATGLEKIINI